jgi:LemA protein
LDAAELDERHKENMNLGLWSGIGVAAVLAVLFILVFNAMIRSRNRVDEAWSGIDVQLRRRHDLVPKLVATVKGYARHERHVFEWTARARADAMRALGSSPQAEVEAEAELSRAVVAVGAVAEAYPQLRAAESFQTLQRQLAQIEDEIQAARRIYNSNAQAFNTKIQIFPNVLIAWLAGFSERDYFEDVDVGAFGGADFEQR